MRFYLDEDLSQRIADLGRQRGMEIVSSHECGRDGLSDEDQLRLAAGEGRCLVTKSYADFTLLTHRFWEMAWPHAGVLFIGPGLHSDRFSDIAEALLQHDQKYTGGLLPYQVDYLRQAEDVFQPGRT